MSAAPPFRSIGHGVLFAEDEPKLEACDVCGEPVRDDDEPSDEAPHADGASAASPQAGPYEVAGRGLYVFARGDEIRREEPPLCPSCAAALGLSALARWEIEEEEG